MPNFAVTLVHGPGWDPARPIRAQDAWDEQNWGTRAVEVPLG
jgi:hypothetical protein